MPTPELTPSRRDPPAGRCAVCAARAGRVVDHRHGYDLVQCGCGAMFLTPEPCADAVDPTEDRHPDSFYALPAQLKVRWLRRTCPTGTLLEVGCGRGYFLAEAQRAGFAVAGIEADPQRADAIAERLRIPVEVALLEASKRPDASCDVVYHCDLLSHFPDPAGALQRMRRMLRPGGIMFFEVGLVGRLATAWYRRMPDHSLPRHRWFFDHGSLRQLLYTTGFTLLRIQDFTLGPQVLLYRCASHLRRWWRGAPRRPEQRPPTGPPRERPAEGQINNWLRFGLGRHAPGFGPATAFVIAAPRGDRS